MKGETPKEQVATGDIPKHSATLLKITGTVLTVLLGGGLIGLVTSPTADRRIVVLYVAAVAMGGFGAFAGALISWSSRSTRMRLLYNGQIIALGGLVFCLGGVAVVLLFSSPPAPCACEVNPTSVEASGQAEPHQDNSGNYFTYEPEKAIDGVDNTAWRVDGNGKGEWIQLNYTDPVEVSAVGIIPGHDKIDPVGGTDRFYQLYVVRRALIKFSDETVMEAEFKRDRSMQFVYLNSPTTIEWVRIEIQETYPPGDNPNGEQYTELVPETAISEIQIK